MAAANVGYTCRVLGLARDTNEEALQEAFASFGEITDLKVVNNCGFVTFSSEQAMRDAVDGMNRQDLGGCNITVSKHLGRPNGGSGDHNGGSVYPSPAPTSASSALAASLGASPSSAATVAFAALALVFDLAAAALASASVSVTAMSASASASATTASAATASAAASPSPLASATAASSVSLSAAARKRKESKDFLSS